MTVPDAPKLPETFINSEEVRRRQKAGERLRVRYEPLPWTGRPAFAAVYTLEDGSERTFVSMRIRNRRFEPKALALWPGVWSHHVEYGDGGPIVVPVTAPLEEGSVVEGPQPRARGRRPRKADEG